MYNNLFSPQSRKARKESFIYCFPLIDFPLPSFLSAGIFGGSTAKEKTLNSAFPAS